MVADIREPGTAMVLFFTQHGPAHNRSAHVARVSTDDHAFYAVVETGSTCHPSANTAIMATSLSSYFFPVCQADGFFSGGLQNLSRRKRSLL
jgi:hypothetical protein